MHAPSMHNAYTTHTPRARHACTGQGYLCFKSGMTAGAPSEVMPLAEIDAFYTGSSLEIEHVGLQA